MADVSTLLDLALSYAARGWLVFPLRARDKVPATRNGFKDATTNVERIRGWWEQCPDYNIGIATGQASGLVVMDFDADKGGLDSYSSLTSLLHDTFEVATGGGGVHLYYAHPGVPIHNKQGLYPGMDIRGDGGYVVGPGSVHPNGKSYVRLGQTPTAALSQYWVDVLIKQPEAPSPHSVELPEGSRGDLNKRTLRFIANGSAPGTWHQEYFQAAMNLKQNGYTYEEAEAMLTKVTGVLDDEHDIPQLLDVYENREPVHPPDVSLIGASPIAAEVESLNVPASQFLSGMFRTLSDPAKVKGMPTGIEGLDRLLGGGKRLGELTVTMATAKTGKSVLYAYLIHSLLERGQAVGYASREMRPDSEVLPNILSIACNENVQGLAAQGAITEAKREQYAGIVNAWPLHFAKGYGPFPIESFRSWVGEMRKKGVTSYFIDHLHYSVEDEDDWGLAVSLVRELKTLAITEEIHIDLIVQPTKIADGVRLGLNSLKGGSGIGQALDNLFFLEHTGTKNVRKLTLDRARFTLADPGCIYLQYDPHNMRFYEVKPDEEPPQAAVVPMPPTWNGSGFRVV